MIANRGIHWAISKLRQWRLPEWTNAAFVNRPMNRPIVNWQSPMDTFQASNVSNPV
jgi:hypothetical protein